MTLRPADPSRHVLAGTELFRTPPARWPGPPVRLLPAAEDVEEAAAVELEPVGLDIEGFHDRRHDVDEADEARRYASGRGYFEPGNLMISGTFRLSS